MLVNSSEDVFRLMERGQRQRFTSQTSMNDASSRSHAIFQLMVVHRDKNTGSILRGKLNLVRRRRPRPTPPPLPPRPPCLCLGGRVCFEEREIRAGRGAMRRSSISTTRHSPSPVTVTFAG